MNQVRAVSNAINEILWVNNITEKELANKLGCSQSTVRNWIKGKNFPSSRYSWKIKEMYGVKLGQIIINSMD